MALTLSHLCFQQTEVIIEFIQSSQVLNSPELQLFAVALVKNTLPTLAMDPWSCSQHGALVEMAVHMAAVLLCGLSPVLQPLRNLAFQPHCMQVSTQSPACACWILCWTFLNSSAPPRCWSWETLGGGDFSAVGVN